MAKKKKSNAPVPRPQRAGDSAAQRADAATAAALERAKLQRAQSGDDFEFTDLFKHPLLIVAWASLMVTVFAIWAAIRFRHDLAMGELSEPTHLVVWAAITFTLFASYRRYKRRAAKSDS